jgi:glycosyltransferase involved in cell wall biosynthesis
MEASEVDRAIDALSASRPAANALVRRLRTAVSAISEAGDPSSPGPDDLPVREGIATGLHALEAALNGAYGEHARRIGLFFLAVTGTSLDADELERLSFEYAHEVRSLVGLLVRIVRRSPTLALDAVDVELVPFRGGRLLVDVTHTDQWPTISGVQRVVRRTCQEMSWTGTPFQLMRYRPERRAFELFTEAEAEAFFAFESAMPGADPPRESILPGWIARAERAARRAASYVLREVLPTSIGHPLWRKLRRMRDARRAGPAAPHRPRRVPIFLGADIAILEVVLEPERVDAYLSLHRQADFRLGMVGYDLIPVYQPQYCVISAGFMHYLRLLRIADRISCISAFTREQFTGFLRQIERMKPQPPEVATHLLAGDLIPSARPTPPAAGDPLVLCVGTLDNRKNQLGVLRAAMLLWKRGRRFRLALAGTYGLGHERIVSAVEAAQRDGMPVRVHPWPRDAELAALYTECRFTTFCSFSEGFGLPIIESFAFGRPCVTSDRGSMAELAADGGCILADPDSPEAIARAMDSLLGDEALYARLRAEIDRRPGRTWAEYAAEVSAFLRTSADLQTAPPATRLAASGGA